MRAGKEETGFLSYTCNAHTHGMERYGHPDFQIVLSLPPREIGEDPQYIGTPRSRRRTLLPWKICFRHYADCDIRLDEFRETGRKVLRVIIPDRHYRFPEDPQCEEPYRLQSMDTEALHRKDGALS